MNTSRHVRVLHRLALGCFAVALMVAVVGAALAAFTAQVQPGRSTFTAAGDFGRVTVPTSTAAPTISGTGATGQTLTAAPGTWTDAPDSFTFQWLRCAAATGACTAVAGQTGSTYTLTSADAGGWVAVDVGAVNAAGTSTPARSAHLGPISAGVPVNTGAPQITAPGGLTAGSVLTSDTGSWTGSPTRYSFTWQRCTAETSGTCTNVAAGETLSSYTLTGADVGQWIRVRVWATNSAGPGTLGNSARVGPISSASSDAPTVIAAPQISGATEAGQTLTATTGSWTGTPSSYTYQWTRRTAPDAYTPIAGATGATYIPGPSDVGFALAVQVTATGPGGSGMARSPDTAAVTDAPSAPTNTTAPAMSGTAKHGQTLTVTTGSWTALPSSYSFQWHRCSAASAGTCTAIAGATGATYTLTGADVGQWMTVTVTASGASGSASAQPAGRLGAVASAAPTSTAAPTLSATGAGVEGQQVTASPGSWTESPTSFTFSWQRCTSSSGGCASIAGAAAATYTLTGADVGRWVRVQVSAVNALASSTTPASSATLGPVTAAASAPANTAAPQISGTAQVDGTLTASAGSWTGSPTSYAYQWQTCTSAAASSCTSIASATSSTLTLGAAQQDLWVRVQVAATGAGGTTTASSATVGPVAAAEQGVRNLIAPTIMGTVAVGHPLTVDIGTWSLPDVNVLVVTWYACNGPRLGCDTIYDADHVRYTPTADTVGRYLHAEIIGEDSSTYDYAVAVTPAVGPVAATAPGPAVTAAPQISGSPRTGQQVTASTGTWSGAPSSFTYHWLRCRDAICAKIPGATLSTYTVTSAERGMTLDVEVVAANAFGQSTSLAAQRVGPVDAPTVTAAPQISGTPTYGASLTATPGTWTGSPSFTYQWQTCTSVDAGTCTDLTGATTASRPLNKAEYVGRWMRVRVTASNGYGSASATSAPAGPIAAAGPTNTAAPQISGTAQVGAVLTAATGTWTPTPTSYAYQWQTCTSAAASSCTSIAAATSSTFALGAAQQDLWVRVQVAATGAGGTTTASSLAAGPVAAPSGDPVSVRAPALLGSAVVGQPVRYDIGEWSEPVSWGGVEWYACTNATNGSCTHIDYSQADELVLPAWTAGQWLRAAVWADPLDGGYGVQASTARVQIAASTTAPQSTAPPQISGTPAVGQTLSVAPGTWTGAPSSYTYQWLRCEDHKFSCQIISSASGSSYTLSTADHAKVIDVVVTAAGSGGAQAAFTAQSTGRVGAPHPTAAPSISGLLALNQTLTGARGTWVGSPTYQTAWQQCDSLDPATCTTITGATSSTRRLAAAQVGKHIRLRISATNATGTTVAYSPISPRRVVDVAPVNTAAPALQGSTVEGDTLTAQEGTWTGDEITFSYVWHRCTSADVASCREIANETARTKKTVQWDRDEWIMVKVTAANDAGSASAQSALLGPIAPVTPALDTPPTMPGGSPVVGQTLAVPTPQAQWRNFPDPYEPSGAWWQGCSNAAATSCSFIGPVGGGSSPLTLTADMAGMYIVRLARACNTAGCAPDVRSAALGPVVASGSPVASTAPTITGTPSAGQTLTVQRGTWTAAPSSYSMRWQSCTDRYASGCVNLTGWTTTATLAVSAAHAGLWIRAEVRATNVSGATVVPAVPVGPVS